MTRGSTGEPLWPSAASFDLSSSWTAPGPQQRGTGFEIQPISRGPGARQGGGSYEAREDGVVRGARCAALTGGAVLLLLRCSDGWRLGGSRAPSREWRVLAAHGAGSFHHPAAGVRRGRPRPSGREGGQQPRLVLDGLPSPETGWPGRELGTARVHVSGRLSWADASAAACRHTKKLVEADPGPTPPARNSRSSSVRNGRTWRGSKASIAKRFQCVPLAARREESIAVGQFFSGELQER